MAYILEKERGMDPQTAFDNYRRYLYDNRELFPKSAFHLAISDWYFDPNDNRCPHDGWLEECAISELATGSRKEIRRVSIKLRILDAYHKGFIELFYPTVFSYRLTAIKINNGHHDFRYDEFRISKSKHLIHEIEWNNEGRTALWRIESDDICYSWIPV